MEITDRELLAICNLSNLKMEFADVVKEKQRVPDPNNSGKFIEKILSNHTIYSLLAKEREAILNKDKDATVKKEHVFVRKETSSYGEEPKSKIIYEDIINFKKEAGLVYEYFEKYSLGNSQGKFTEEWEILDSFDGYELLKRYYDIQKELSHQGLYYDNELGQRIFLYEISSEKKNQILQKEKDNLKNKDKKINNQENKERYSYLRKAIFDKERKYIEVSNLEVTEEEGMMYEEYYSDIDSIKLYPTREEIERKIEMEKLFEKIYFAINVAFIIIPAIGSKIRTIKREKTLETIVEDIKKIDQSKLGSKLEEELFFTKKERQKVMEALNSPEGDGTDLIKKIYREHSINRECRNHVIGILKENNRKITNTQINKEIRKLKGSLNKENKKFLAEVSKKIDDNLKENIISHLESFNRATFELEDIAKLTNFAPTEKTIMSKIADNSSGNFVSSFFIQSLSSKEFRQNIINSYSSAVKDLKKQLVNKNYLGAFLVDLPFISSNLISEVTKNIEEGLSELKMEELSDEEKEVLKELEDLKVISKRIVSPQTTFFEEYMDIMNDGFKVIILKKDKELVICFGNPPEGSKVRENIKVENILGETMMMSLVDSLILGGIIEKLATKEDKTFTEIGKEYTVTITGNGYGADLADLYYCTQENLDLFGFTKQIRTYKQTENNLLQKLYEFDTRDLEVFYRVQANTFGNIVLRELSPFNSNDAAYFILSLVLDIGFNGFTFFYGSIVMKIILNTGKWLTEIKNREIIDKLYVKLCKNKVFECSNYEKCSKENFTNCLRTNNQTFEYKTDITIKPTEKIIDILKNTSQNINLYTFPKGREHYSIYQENLFKQLTCSFENYLNLTIDLELLKEISLIKNNYTYFEEKVENNVKILENKFEEIFNKKELLSKYKIPLHIRKDSNNLIVKYFNEYEEYLKCKTKLEEKVKLEKKAELEEKIELEYILTKDLRKLKYNKPYKETKVYSNYKIFLSNDGNILDLKKYSQTKSVYFSNITEFTNNNYGAIRPISYKLFSESEPIVEIEKPVERLLIFLEFSRKQKERIKEIIEKEKTATYYIIGNYNDITIKRGSWFNELKLEDTNYFNQMTEFFFFPFIDDNGNFSMKTNGETSYYHINEKYVGSVFRSLFSKGYYNKLGPKYYYTSEEALNFNLICKENQNKWDYDKNTYQNIENMSLDDGLSTHKLILINEEKGSQLTKAFLEDLLSKDREYLIAENRIIACKQVLDYLKDIYTQQEYDKLEKYYLLLEIPESQGLKKELRVGHLLPNGEYNEKEIQYVYNDKDDIKRGILVLEGWIPGAYSQGEVQSAELDELVSGATLKCTGGEGTVSFEGVNNKGNTTGGKVIGAETDNKISCFKHCNILDGGCGISTPGNWLNPGSTTGTNGVKNITTKSVIKCEIGGTIYVVKNGVDKVKKSN